MRKCLGDGECVWASASAEYVSGRWLLSWKLWGCWGIVCGCGVICRDDEICVGVGKCGSVGVLEKRLGGGGVDEMLEDRVGIGRRNEGANVIKCLFNLLRTTV